MASTNQSPFYKRAEEDFHKATTDEERIRCLEIMIKECPKHKSSENMLKNLKTRLKKIKESSNKKKQGGQGSKTGIRKEDCQCVLTGPPNSGKSTIFNILTKNNPYSKVTSHPFTTYEPIMAMIRHDNTPIQLIDDAPRPNHDKSINHSADILLVVVEDFDQIRPAKEQTQDQHSKKIYIINKTDRLNEQEKRKLEAKIKSKHNDIDYIFFNKKEENTQQDKLKEKILKNLDIIRVYTKEPKKEVSKEPMLLKPGSSISDAAEKILKGMSKKIKKTRIWGPSSKFPGQAVGKEHILKDKDIIELRTE